MGICLNFTVAMVTKMANELGLTNDFLRIRYQHS